jgi:Fe-S cluster assembly ATP-binding protein
MKKNLLLNIKNLFVTLENKLIINNLNLKIKENEIHVIMGPNGSGKSTLSKILVGHPSYKVQSGAITYLQKNLLNISPLSRSYEGIFLGFQSPIEIPGITNYDFLKLIYNQKQKYYNKKELTSLEFIKIIEILLKKLNLNFNFLNRNVNENFSGGEKKYNEILQMLLLNPKLIILDELDSGLDLDAIKIIFNDILKNIKTRASILLITHNPKILFYLKPNYIYIMRKGSIVKKGTVELLKNIETLGYNSM